MRNYTLYVEGYRPDYTFVEYFWYPVVILPARSGNGQGFPPCRPNRNRR